MKFRTVFLLCVLAELTSYAGYFSPAVGTIGFFVIVGAAFVYSLKRLEYGLYFILADLVLGGKSGALFSFQHQGFFISLRMALFIVVMAVWASKLKIKDLRLNNLSAGLLKWWGLFGIAVVWGVVVALVRHTNFGDLFLDLNGYLYAALLGPFYFVRTRKDFIPLATPKRDNIVRVENANFLRMLGAVFFATTTWLGIKTLFSVYWFTHAGNNFIAANLIPFYRWVRDSGVGEITWLPGNFARVFFQSHVYIVAAFFLVFVWYLYKRNHPTIHGLSDRKLIALLVLYISVIIVSFSRSFWVGICAGILLWAVVVIIRKRNRASLLTLCSGLSVLLGSAVIAVALLVAVARFPFPRPSTIDLSSAAASRFIAGDAGASRWNLVGPLVQAGLRHPIFGSGFGTTVTYISNDPRIRGVNVTGQYTTYAFEWGWLDIWLKMGVLGLIGYAVLIGICLREFLRRGIACPICNGGLLVIVALTVIHVFTPYLNHPLGFGILLLATLHLTDHA